MSNPLRCAQLRYTNNKEFIAIATALEIMKDFKVRINQRLIKSFSNTDISDSVRFLYKSFSTIEY